MPKFVGPVDHHLDRNERRVVQRQDPLASFIPAPADVKRIRLNVAVPATEVLDLNTAHDVLAARTAAGSVNGSYTGSLWRESVEALGMMRSCPYVIVCGLIHSPVND